MSYAANLIKFSRIIQNVLIINLESCDNTFGIAPCTATGSVKCYKTLYTCQDPDNFVTTDGKDYKICMDKKPLPFPGEVWRPYMIRPPRYRATEIDPVNSLTKRARITYSFLNPDDNDIGIDPHVDERSTYPGNVGPFWDLLLARNIYYQGRNVIDKTGFHEDPENEYVSRRFTIDKAQFNTDGTFKLICKDLLIEADKVNIPIDTDGKVADNPLVAGAALINTSADTDMSQYPTAGWIHVGGEGENIIKYTGKSGQQFTGCTWQQFGTAQANASQDTKIQLGYVKESTNVVDIITDILENQIGYDANDINSAEFTSEKNLFLPNYIFTVGWFEPTKGNKRLEKLQIQASANTWWDEELEKIRFKVFAPAQPDTAYASLTETDNIKEITLTDYNESSRISRVIVYFDLIDNTLDLDKPASYKQVSGDIAISSEGPDRYRTKAIKQIFADGIQSSLIADSIVQRFKRRFLDPPRKYKIIVERKDADIETAEIVQLTHRRNIKTDGTIKEKALFQVLKRQQNTPGTLSLTVLDTKWNVRYGFICHAGYPDYNDADDIQRQHCFIGNGNNLVGSSDELGYHIF